MTGGGSRRLGGPTYAAGVRQDPQRLNFVVDARDGVARAGVIETPHGPIETPTFIPLATKGSVRGLDADEVAALG